MRTPKPWYRRQNDKWYICLGGQQILLAEGKASKKEAERTYFRLMATERKVPAKLQSQILMAILCDQFLDWAKQHLQSYEWYRSFLEDFAHSYGNLAAQDLKPIHVTQWLSKKTWGPTTQNKVIGIIKRVLNWGVEQGLIHDNPIRQLRKPTPRRRERLITAEERQEIYNHARGQAFKDYIFAMQETGARPGEIRQLTRENIDLKNGLWIFAQNHKTYKQTKKPRVIYLTPAMTALTERLLKDHVDGPVFRNSRGKPWTRNAIRCRFSQLRKKLPQLKDVVSYCYRHSFTTDGLERGVPIATMAELLGHKSTAMISAHYGHLAEKRGYLSQAVIAVTKPVLDECV